MDVLAVISPSHKVLYEQFFLNTIPAEARKHELRTEVVGEGNYLSKDWQDGVLNKLKWALKFAEDNPDTMFVLSDVDIQFMPNFSFSLLQKTFEDSGVDILFQAENPRKSAFTANTGFYIARSTPYVVDLLHRALEFCLQQEVFSCQRAFNTVLEREDRGKRWDLLPTDYYARSHGFPPSNSILIHHANCTENVESKVKQLHRVYSYVNGNCFSKLKSFLIETCLYLKAGNVRRKLYLKLLRFVRLDPQAQRSYQ